MTYTLLSMDFFIIGVSVDIGVATGVEVGVGAGVIVGVGGGGTRLPKPISLAFSISTSSSLLASS